LQGNCAILDHQVSLSQVHICHQHSSMSFPRHHQGGSPTIATKLRNRKGSCQCKLSLSTFCPQLNGHTLDLLRKSYLLLCKYWRHLGHSQQCYLYKLRTSTKWYLRDCCQTGRLQQGRMESLVRSCSDQHDLYQSAKSSGRLYCRTRRSLIYLQSRQVHNFLHILPSSSS